MWDEYSEFSLYGNRDGLEFDVSVTRNATRAELADVLTSMGDTDFFHYIGHVRDGTQFVCTDGALSFDQIAATTTPPRVFLLNGCSSYELGRAFIDAGSQAGIITVRPIGNDAAMLIGQNIARFVNQGFRPGPRSRSSSGTGVPTTSTWFSVMGAIRLHRARAASQWLLT